jgi:hypothetical protein
MELVYSGCRARISALLQRHRCSLALNLYTLPHSVTKGLWLSGENRMSRTPSLRALQETGRQCA